MTEKKQTIENLCDLKFEINHIVYNLDRIIHLYLDNTIGQEDEIGDGFSLIRRLKLSVAFFLVE